MLWFFGWAKYPHTETCLTSSTCKSIDGTLSLNCIQIKTNSGNAHRNYQYKKVSLIFKMSQKSQIIKPNMRQKIHFSNTDALWRKTLAWLETKRHKFENEFQQFHQFRTWKRCKLLNWLWSRSDIYWKEVNMNRIIQQKTLENCRLS